MCVDKRGACYLLDFENGSDVQFVACVAFSGTV